ncbi:hypothetical protein APUTEX25_001162, partial [Auxenochlorella protothecoides]
AGDGGRGRGREGGKRGGLGRCPGSQAAPGPGGARLRFRRGTPAGGSGGTQHAARARPALGLLCRPWSTWPWPGRGRAAGPGPRRGPPGLARGGGSRDNVLSRARGSGCGAGV